MEHIDFIFTMHFYYLDEAGCTGADLENEEQPIFVLGGISVRDEGWNATQESLAGLISAYFEGAVPAGFELHAEELLSPEGDGPFAGHTRNRRNELAQSALRLLDERRHDVHLIGLDKAKLRRTQCNVDLPFDSRVPFLLAYDYMITFINWFVKEKLGRSARGLIILDTKKEFHQEVETITSNRRFEGPAAHRVKWIAEFSYPVDSHKNPMVQLSDLVVYCVKKFLEVDNGYRNDWPVAAKKFFVECYSLIDSRIARKELIERGGRDMDKLNDFLGKVRSEPVGRWRQRYGLK
jgi:hypothetical protein